MPVARLIMIAALADLSEDALAFVREFDTDITDPTIVARALPRIHTVAIRRATNLDG